MIARASISSVLPRLSLEVVREVEELLNRGGPPIIFQPIVDRYDFGFVLGAGLLFSGGLFGRKR